MLRLEDTDWIEKLVSESEHLGTYAIPASHGLRTKTFNKYKHKSTKKIIITNHYANELVNAQVFDNEEAFDNDENWRGFTWNFYTVPMMPS